MIEIEAKTKLKSSEGAHFFFTLIFLTASGLIERSYATEVCAGLNLRLLVDLVFYSQIIKGTYQLITMVPRYKNRDIVLFFEFLDIAYYLFLFGLFVFANVLYFSSSFDGCAATAPVLVYFTEFFLLVTYIVFIIILLSGITYLFRRLSRSNVQEHEFEQLE